MWETARVSWYTKARSKTVKKPIYPDPQLIARISMQYRAQIPTHMRGITRGELNFTSTFLPPVTISFDIRYGWTQREKAGRGAISAQFQPIMRTLHRRVLARSCGFRRLWNGNVHRARCRNCNADCAVDERGAPHGNQLRCGSSIVVPLIIAVTAYSLRLRVTIMCISLM